MIPKSFAVIALAVLTCASCGIVPHDRAVAPEPAPRIVRHADLARTIVRMMGEEANMPAGATALDYQSFLAGKGIAPLGGWRHLEPVTKGDLAVVTVKLLKLQDRVEDPLDEAAYIALLESLDLRTLFD